MTAARRLGSILFADVIGYSRLMGEVAIASGGSDRLGPRACGPWKTRRQSSHLKVG